MIDLPKLLEVKRKHEAANQLGDVYKLIATNNRSIEEADYKTYIRGLNKEIGIKPKQTFDREKFEQLRQFAK
jgi:hypothetical protein